MDTKTVRELGGEIWAELNMERQNSDSPLGSLDWTQVNAISDFVMSILARHAGSQLINDEGLEVTARPISGRTAQGGQSTQA